MALEHAALDQPEWKAAYTGLGFQRPQQFAGHFKIGKMYARKVRDTRHNIPTRTRSESTTGAAPCCTAAPLHCCTTAH